MKNKKGFTLVEIIAVVAIIAIVGGIFAINMTSKNKNSTSKDEAIATIKAAAEAYISINDEIYNKLNNGYTYVDIPLQELKDAGLIDDETIENYGNINASIRISIQEIDGQEDVLLFELDENENNMNASIKYHIVAQNLTYSSANAPSNLCKDTSKAIIEDEIGNKSATLDSMISITQCNYKKEVGTYNITYSFEYDKMKASKTISVSVIAPNQLNTNITINNGNTIDFGTPLEQVPVIIIEQRSNDLSNNVINTNLQELKDDKVEGYVALNKDEIVTKPETTTIDLVGGKYPTMNITLNIKNISLNKVINVDYIVYKESPKISGANGYITYNSQYKDYNFIRYEDSKTIFRIYNVDQENKIVKLITNESYTDSQIAYGLLDKCYSPACEQGRKYYSWLGDDKRMKSKEHPYMIDKLDEFALSIPNKDGKPIFAVNGVSFYDKTFANSIMLLSLDEYTQIAGCKKYECNANYLLDMKEPFWLLDIGKDNDTSIDFWWGYQWISNYYVNRESKVSLNYVEGVGIPYYWSEYYGSYNYIRPTLTLQNVKINDGTGTSFDPYIMTSEEA